MPQIFNIVYPKRGTIKLDGGLNNKFEKSLIKDNESPSCFNVVFDDGAVGTRGGTTKLNSAAIGSFTGDGLYTRTGNDSQQTMIAFAGGTAWELGTTTFTTIGSAQSVFTAGVRVGAAQYENHLFCGNGGVIPYKYNGTDFTRHGVYPPPDSLISIATNSNGTLTGDYQYKITYVNSQAVEGNPTTATTLFAASSEELSLTSIPVGPQSWGVASRNIYRTETSGATFHLVTALADNTTTSLTDNHSDSEINGNATPPDDAGVPPKYDAIVYHQNRLFCNDPTNRNYIWYSDLAEPYTFASTNFFRVGDNSGDIVTGLFVHDNSVIVLCRNSIHKLYMPTTTPTDWSMIKLRTGYGSRSPYGCFIWNNRMMFPAFQNDKLVGFASITGGTIDPNATVLENSVQLSDLYSEKIEPDAFTILESAAGDISASVYQNKAYITVPYGAGASENNRIYIFDFSLDRGKEQEFSWTPTDTSSINAAQMTVYGGDLYYISSLADGFVYQLQDGTSNDDDAAIDSYYWTKEFSGQPGHEELQKDFRSISVLVDKAGAYTMDVGVRVDSDKGDGVNYQLDLTPEVAVWNSFDWGGAEWGAGAEQEEITLYLGQITGKRIQLKFGNQNAADQRFKVHGLKITYNIKGKR